VVIATVLQHVGIAEKADAIAGLDPDDGLSEFN
jgi:hypothetical protein